MERADALTKWLDALVTNFSDRIHPAGGEVYARASEIMRHWQRTDVRVRYHDVLLAATAQIYGHGLLTEEITGLWLLGECQSGVPLSEAPSADVVLHPLKADGANARVRSLLNGATTTSLA